MGCVYRAEDTNLQREVALKLLPAGVTADKARRRRFLREARTAAGLTHPNIATVFEAGEAEGRVFLAMEPVRGVLVREMLRQGPLPVPRAIAVAREHPLALEPRGPFGLVRGRSRATRSRSSGRNRA